MGVFSPTLGFTPVTAGTTLVFVALAAVRDSKARTLTLTFDTFSFPGMGRNADRMGVRTLDELVAACDGTGTRSLVTGVGVEVRATVGEAVGLGVRVFRTFAEIAGPGSAWGSMTTTPCFSKACFCKTAAAATGTGGPSVS